MRIRLKHERLAEALAKSPLTLNRWAQKMKLRSGHLSELANGKRLYPTARTRAKLLEGLGLDFDDLFELETPEPQPEPAPQTFSNAGSAEPAFRRARRSSSMPRPALLTFFPAALESLRTAARGLRKAPGFTATTLLVLTLGLGTTFALFAVVYTSLFRAYDLPDEHELVIGQMVDEDRGGARMSFSLPDLLDLQAAHDPDFIDLAGWDWEPYSLAGGDRPLRAPAGRVTANFLRVAGLRLLQGRWFTEEERRGDEQLVVLRESLWQSSFGGDPAIVGRQVLLDGAPATVLGVAPNELSEPDGVLLWVPLRGEVSVRSRGSRWLGVLARLGENVDMESAQVALNTTAISLGREYPITNANTGVVLETLRTARVGSTRSAYLSTFALVLLLLTLVAANASSLFFARAVARGPELAVRSALGATTTHLVRQTLAEIFLLSAAALLLGTLVAQIFLSLMLDVTPADNLPGWLDTSLDGTLILFGIGTTVAVGVAASLLALWRTARYGRSSQRAGVSGSARAVQLRNALVVGQVVLTTVLVTTAMLSSGSLFRLHQVDPGFETEGSLLVGLDLLSLRSQPEEVPLAFERYRDALAQIPGVTAVGAVDHVAISTRSNHGGVTVENPKEGEDYNPRAQVIHATPDYPDALGLRLLSGRGFSPLDRELREALVSKSLAERWWPLGESLGQRFKLGRPEDDLPWYEVIGTVGDVHQFGLDRELSPTIYTTWGSDRMTRSTWVLRAPERAPADLAADVRTAVEAIDPNQPLYGVLPMTQHVDQSLWVQRFLAAVFSYLSVVALLLAGAGLAGVISYTVSLRRAEIGLRMALGATPRAVTRMFSSSGLRLTGFGLALGLPAAVGASNLLAAVLHGVRTFDPLLLAAVTVVLLASSWIATLAPARRAAGVDPKTALHAD